MSFIQIQQPNKIQNILDDVGPESGPCLGLSRSSLGIRHGWKEAKSAPSQIHRCTECADGGDEELGRSRTNVAAHVLDISARIDNILKIVINSHSPIIHTSYYQRNNLVPT